MNGSFSRLKHAFAAAAATMALWPGSAAPDALAQRPEQQEIKAQVEAPTSLSPSAYTQNTTNQETLAGIHQRFVENSKTLCREVTQSPSSFGNEQTLRAYTQYCGMTSGTGIPLPIIQDANIDNAFYKLMAPSHQGGLNYFAGDEPPFSLPGVSVTSNDNPVAYLSGGHQGLAADPITNQMDDPYKHFFDQGAAEGFHAFLNKNKSSDDKAVPKNDAQLRIDATASVLDHLKNVPDKYEQASSVNLLGNALIQTDTIQGSLLDPVKGHLHILETGKISGTPEEVLQSGKSTCSGMAVYKLAALRDLGYDPKDLWLVHASKPYKDGKQMMHAVPGVVINGNLVMLNNNTLDPAATMLEQKNNGLRTMDFGEIAKGSELADPLKFFGPKDDRDPHNTGYTPLAAMNLNGEKVRLSPDPNADPFTNNIPSSTPSPTEEDKHHLASVRNTISEAHNAIAAHNAPDSRTLPAARQTSSWVLSP